MHERGYRDGTVRRLWQSNERGRRNSVQVQVQIGRKHPSDIEGME